MGWFTVHVHLGLSSRPELISVEEGGCRGSRQREVGREGGSKLEGRRVRSGWLATCPDDISRFVCLAVCFSASGGGGRGSGGQRARGRWGGFVCSGERGLTEN